MNTEAILSNALLWAAAIVAAAIFNAPTMLTLMVLPTLAAMSVIYSMIRAPKRPCRRQPGAA